MMAGAAIEDKEVYAAPPPTGPPLDTQPLSKEQLESNKEPEPGPPKDFDFLRQGLIDVTGAMEQATDQWVLQMNEFEANLIASGLGRYVERQPDSLVAHIVEHSDVGAVAIGGGSYIFRTAVSDFTRLREVLQEMAQKREEEMRRMMEERV